MSSQVVNNDFFKSKVLGHPAGLFVLFFTEMWERFSFYGMRVLLINFLTMAAIGTNPGWEWTSENAGALFGTYAGLLYLTPIAGGIIADKLTGYRWAVVIGAIIMTLGHASMALETEFSLYLGLGLLVVGTGFFKPNMTSIISEMYKDLPEKKDGAYTIFYMGVNAGAFFGMMLCGYLAEKVGWSWGFGLAGIFMLLGMLQFWLAKPLFGTIGDVPSKTTKHEDAEISPDGRIEDKAISNESKPAGKLNNFTLVDKVLIVITSLIGLLYLIDDPASKIGNIHLLPEQFILSKDILPGSIVITIIGLLLFLYLVISRIVRYEKVVRDRMIAVIVFAFFTIFFWMSFEQGATSLVLFARDFTDRTLSGNSAIAFFVIDTLLTIVPLLLISWVLYLLFRKTFNRIGLSNIILALSFIGVWGIVAWKMNNDFTSQAYQIKYQAIKSAKLNEETKEQEKDEKGEPVFEYTPVTESTVLNGNEVITDQFVDLSDQEIKRVNDKVTLHSEIGKMMYLTKEKEDKIRGDYKKAGRPSLIVPATISEIKENHIEITTSWFSILNSFFIIVFASLFSKWWDSKYNPSAAVKYGLGLIIMGVGFGILAYGTQIIPPGAAAGSVRVSLVWLVLAYLFHTLGELCLSPVGLSYVSKLVPARMIAFMFGMWYLAIAIGNKLAGTLGGQIENITKEYSLSVFFLIFTIVPVVAGLIVMSLNPMLKKLMHGVK
ncbi:peptide MFS transporter [Flavobacterium sp. C4GT6]|uniref:peptide MFS transporter n=1 Tax=Flavobacterium sp. C4GT6 TaxID=3103818 RepID=UPI002ED36E1F